MYQPESNADRIFAAAFAQLRDPRSAQYKKGVLDVLRFRLHETAAIEGIHKYRPGTAKADAYSYGCDEGHRRAREYLARFPKAPPRSL